MEREEREIRHKANIREISQNSPKKDSIVSFGTLSNHFPSSRRTREKGENTFLPE